MLCSGGDCRADRRVRLGSPWRMEWVGESFGLELHVESMVAVELRLLEKVSAIADALAIYHVYSSSGVFRLAFSNTIILIPYINHF
jgi:hypothetical protein